MSRVVASGAQGEDSQGARQRFTGQDSSRDRVYQGLVRHLRPMSRVVASEAQGEDSQGAGQRFTGQDSSRDRVY